VAIRANGRPRDKGATVGICGPSLRKRNEKVAYRGVGKTTALQKEVDLVNNGRGHQQRRGNKKNATMSL